MTTRVVNLALLILLAFELATGLGSFLVGEAGGRWMFWLHRAGGLALVVLLVWKSGIAKRSYRRRGLGAGTGLSALFGFLFLGSLLTVLLWATVEVGWAPVPILGSWTVLSLHVALSVLLIPLLLAHAFLRWPRPRRAVLRLLGLLAIGSVLWGAQEALAAVAAPSSQARRRFTGSREEASFAGNRHPVTNWLGDRVQRINPDRWQLRIHGSVERETVLSYQEIISLGGATRRATLDCTGGWYTVQHWSGVPVADLLQRAGLADGARSLLFRSATGYGRRFAPDEADDLLLATHVEGEPLSAGHGFPLRLVARDHRGYAWVK